MRNIALVALFFAAVSNASSQGIQLQGRSAIELNVGLWHELRAASEHNMRSGVVNTATASGFAGGLLFSYWQREDISFFLSLGLLSAEAGATYNPWVEMESGSTQQASSVVTIGFGTRYFFLSPSAEDRLRPFLSASIGPVLGFEAKNTMLAQESRTQAALGIRIGLGADYLLGNRFKLGANAGYNLMTNFSTPVGARRNYNAPDISVGLGFIFGS
jgi:hypothetical protein